MQDHGIGSWPARRARMSPGQAALVQRGRSTTYAELDRRVNRLANGLIAGGVEPGDRVAFLGPNSVELVEVMFAAARAGAVFLPLNTRLAPPEFDYILRDSEPRLVVTHRGTAELPAVPGVAVAEIGEPGSGLGALYADDDSPYDRPVGADDLFMIQYTSGTSGRPKGVELTHGNITWNVYNLLVDVDVTSHEVALVTAPLFHTAALNQLLLPTLLKGGTALIEEKFDAARALDLIESERVTMLFGVTSMYLAICSHARWAEADLSSLANALCGGAPVPETLLRRYLDRGVAIVQGYGLTESSPGATMLRPADAVTKLGSAGTACFFSDVRVVRPDLSDTADDEPGEILVAGPNVSRGYWHNPQATADALIDGEWLHTGDVARRDADGYLYIADRIKDMYISGGENVYPAEVEQALYTHPGIAECAVIGVPDQRWGEVGRAVIVRRDESLTAEAVIDHLRGRLARYKIPHSVTFTDALPHTASGKLQKSQLRARLGRTEATTS